MLVNNQLPGDVYRHNYLRIAFMVGALILFIGHVGVYEFYERGNTRMLTGKSLERRSRVLVFQEVRSMEHGERKID